MNRDATNTQATQAKKAKPIGGNVLTIKQWTKEADKFLWEWFGDQIGTCKVCGHPCVKGYIHCTPDSGAKGE
jgi:hypothetical protein